MLKARQQTITVKPYTAAVILLSALSASAHALTLDSIINIPPNLTFNSVFVGLSGTITGCEQSPKDPDLSIDGTTITIEFALQAPPPGTACVTVIQAWTSVVPLGHLPTGNYEVTVTAKTGDGPVFELGRSMLNIPEKYGVGGAATGIDPRKVVCENLTTGKRKVIKDRAESWNCEAMGLKVKPGHRIRQTVIGIAPRDKPN
jgi:hypothetical protein